MDRSDIKADICGMYIQIFHCEIREDVLGFIFLYVEENIAVKAAIAHCYMMSAGNGDVFSSAVIIELPPGIDIEEVRSLPADVFHAYIFIALGCIGTEFHPQQIVSGGDGDIAEDDIAVMDRL